MQTKTLVKISVAAMLLMAGNRVEAQNLLPQLDPVENNQFYNAAMRKVEAKTAAEKLENRMATSQSDAKAIVEQMMQENGITTRAQVPAYVAQAEEEEHPLTFIGMCQVAFYPDGNLYLPYGMYKFSTKNGLKREPLSPSVNACINFGSAYIGNTLHGYSNIKLPDTGEARSLAYYAWDTDTWLPLENSGYRESNIALISDYDPVTKKVYGIDYADNWDYMYELNTYDFETREQTLVANFDDRIACMAINSKGEAYVLTYTRELCRFDLTTAEFTSIGTLDAEVSFALQDMTFDMRTDKLYLCVSSGSRYSGMIGNLFEVDTTDAHTRLIGYLPEAEEYTCLRVLYTPEDDCPADIADLAMQFVDATSKGSITFTMPSTTMAGQALTGTMDYVVEVDDVELTRGTANAGEQIALDVEAEKEGTHKVVVVVSNAIGEGNRNVAVAFKGNDTPIVRDLTLDFNAETGDAVLNWTANNGEFGGYVNPATQTFTVVRYPDMVKVADNLTECTFTDNLSELYYHGYSYEVTACSDGVAGIAVLSDVVRTGKPHVTPYTVDLRSYNDSTQFTMIDANQDGFGWFIAAVETVTDVYQYRLDYPGSPSADADDWALLPPLTLEAGYAYNLSFDASPTTSSYNEILAVAMGENDDPTTFTTLMEPTRVEGAIRAMQHYDVTVIPDHDGVYRIGFHALSPQSQSVLFVAEISIEKLANLQAPASASSLAVTPGADGDLTATIEFDAPATTFNGDALATISQVDIYRNNGKLIATLTDVKPGQHVVYEDLDAVNGLVTYTITVTNEYGQSVPVEVEAYVGEDVPSEPTGFYAVDNLDGTVTLNWDKEPGAGIHGGYVDGDLLTYIVYMYDGYYMVPVISVEDNTYTVEDLEFGEEQELYYFAVAAVNDLGSSQPVETSIFVGQPDGIPYIETFESGILNHVWSYTTNDPYGFVDIFSGLSADDDGCATGFYADKMGSHALLRSGKISLQDVAGPTFSFAFYNVPNLDDAITALVYVDGKPQPDTLCYHSMLEDGFERGWYSATVKLEKYCKANYIELAFDFYVAATALPYVLIDDIQIVEDITSIEKLEDTSTTAYRMYDFMGRKTGKTSGFGIRINNKGFAEKVIMK